MPFETADGQFTTPLAQLAREVPTASLEASIGDVRERIGDAPFLLLVSDRGVVLGKVLARVLPAADDADPVTAHLIEGPTTVRASEPLAPLVERMDRASTSSVIVTSAEGVLVGVLFRDDADAALERAHHHHDHDHDHGH